MHVLTSLDVLCHYYTTHTTTFRSRRGDFQGKVKATKHYEKHISLDLTNTQTKGWRRKEENYSRRFLSGRRLHCFKCWISTIPTAHMIPFFFPQVIYIFFKIILIGSLRKKVASFFKILFWDYPVLFLALSLCIWRDSGSCQGLPIHAGEGLTFARGSDQAQLTKEMGAGQAGERAGLCCSYFHMCLSRKNLFAFGQCRSFCCLQRGFLSLVS